MEKSTIIKHSFKLRVYIFKCMCNHCTICQTSHRKIIKNFIWNNTCKNMIWNPIDKSLIYDNKYAIQIYACAIYHKMTFFRIPAYLNIKFHVEMAFRLFLKKNSKSTKILYVLELSYDSQIIKQTSTYRTTRCAIVPPKPYGEMGKIGIFSISLIFFTFARRTRK